MTDEETQPSAPSLTLPGSAAALVSASPESPSIASAVASCPHAPLPADRREARKQRNLQPHLQRVQRRLQSVRAAAAEQESRRLMHAGQLVIVYSSPASMQPLLLTPGAVFSNRHGHFHHDDLISAPFASRIRSRKGRPQPAEGRAGGRKAGGEQPAAGSGFGYVVALPVSPQLWTLALSHRTQILYQADISLILLQLELRPGSVVLESGTGSGSLSVAVAAAVAPHGHLHSFDFNQQRVSRAQADFSALGLSPSLITAHHRDVCQLGFPRLLPHADAVFLDLPSPWLTVESAWRALRHQGRLASFSPCIEQVQRLCAALSAGQGQRWTELRTAEVLLREHEVSEQRLARMHRPQRPAQDASTAAAAAAGRKRRRQQDEREQQPDTRDGQQQQQDDDAVEAAVRQQGGEEEEEAAGAQQRQRSHQRAVLAAAGSLAGLTRCAHGEDAAAALYPLAVSSFPLCRGHTGFITTATCCKFIQQQ